MRDSARRRGVQLGLSGMTIEAPHSRRAFLRKLAALGAGLSFPYARSLRAQAAPITTVRLSERMSAFRGPDANVVCADSNDGIIMIDGGHESWSAELLRAVDGAFPGRPVRALFNSHWHTEQTGSNRALGERGVQIIAHENTKLWLGTEVWVRWSGKKYPPLPKVALPTKTFYDSGDIQLGDRKIDYGYMPKAHTDGDIWVFFPDENVLVAGGFVSNDGWPIIDWWTGGWTAGMLDGFDSLLEVANESTRIVPANGPLMSLTELKSQQEMYLTVFERIHELLRKAYGTDEVLAAKPTAEYDAVWGDPEQFVTLAFQSTWLHLRDAYDTRLRNIA
jgi:glyoxylase-like metal-dependent hydrolase (beta-lactamase superfamily II)